MTGAMKRWVGPLILSAALWPGAAPASAQRGWHVGLGLGTGLGISDKSVSPADGDFETTWHIRLGRGAVVLEGDVQYIQIEEAHGTDEMVVVYVGVGPQLRPGGGPAYLRPGVGLALYDFGSDGEFGYHVGLAAGTEAWRFGPVGLAPELGFEVGRIPEFWTYLIGVRVIAVLGGAR